MTVNILKNPYVKNILSALAVALFGFILLNLTFLFDYFFHILVGTAIKFFTPVDSEMTYNWYPPMMHASFVVIIGLISWPIFRSKIGILYKATYMTVPLAVIFATIGMFSYPRPILPYLVGGLFSISVLFYLYHTKQPRLYYYTLILVALSMMIFTLLGGEI